MLWIAPSIPTDSEAARMEKSGMPALLLIPGIDEDGRAGWWSDWKMTHPNAVVQIVNLDGVGTRIDWAWENIAETMEKELAKK